MRTCRSCGSTEAHACPGGYSWVEPDLCSSCAAALAQLAAMADTLVGLEVPILTLTAVHDNLMLALRHPENTGPSRELVEAFLEGFEEVFLRPNELRADASARAPGRVKPLVLQGQAVIGPPSPRPGGLRRYGRSYWNSREARKATWVDPAPGLRELL